MDDEEQAIGSTHPPMIAASPRRGKGVSLAMMAARLPRGERR